MSLQSILSCRSSGEAQVVDLKRRAESLCEKSSLDEEKQLEVQQAAREAEERWRVLLEAAEDTHRCCRTFSDVPSSLGRSCLRVLPFSPPPRQLTAILELMQTFQDQRLQAEARLSQLKEQASTLPRLFPWPGLGERRQALEQARLLQDQIAAMAPVLSDIRTQVRHAGQPGLSPPVAPGLMGGVF